MGGGLPRYQPGGLPRYQPGPAAAIPARWAAAIPARSGCRDTSPVRGRARSGGRRPG